MPRKKATSRKKKAPEATAAPVVQTLEAEPKKERKADVEANVQRLEGEPQNHTQHLGN